MTIGISSFSCSFTNSVNSNSTSLSEASAFLTGLKTSILATSSNWALVDDVATIGSFTEQTGAPKKSFSVRNTSTGEYFRIWFFCPDITTINKVTSDTANTNAKLATIRDKNLCISSSGNIHQFGGIFIGVKDSSIGKDLGYDLSLKFPLMPIGGTITGTPATSGILVSPAYVSSSGTRNFKITVISDGDFLLILIRNKANAQYCLGTLYSRNLLVTRSGDTYTAGAVLFGNSNVTTSTPYYFYNYAINQRLPMFLSSTGSSTFPIMNIDYSYAISYSENSTSLPCVPYVFYASNTP